MIKAFQELEVGYRPKLTYIITQKRNRTRFFADRNVCLARFLLASFPSCWLGSLQLASYLLFAPVVFCLELHPQFLLPLHGRLRVQSKCRANHKSAQTRAHARNIQPTQARFLQCRLPVNELCKTTNRTYKHTRTRLVSSTPQDADRNGNLLAGTVIDRGVCHPIANDFFLCSHGGLKGTSKPTHYYVMYDENDMGCVSLCGCACLCMCVRVRSSASRE